MLKLPLVDDLLKLLSEEQKKSLFCKLYEFIGEFSEKAGFGDPFNYSRGKEIYMSCVLGHKIASTYSKEDAIDEAGEKVEYKSTIGKNIQGTYNGISKQKTWEEQEKYIAEEKIGCYKRHFFARFDKFKLAEMWEMTGQDVMSCLKDKLFKRFNTSSDKKDPRLGASVNKNDIAKFGKKIM